MKRMIDLLRLWLFMNNGKLYYDHSLLVLKEGEFGKKINAEEKNGNPTKTAGSSSNSAFVLKVAQNALLSSGFDVNSDENVRFSIAPDVGSAAFKNWFADSKVVDQNGEPLAQRDVAKR